MKNSGLAALVISLCPIAVFSETDSQPAGEMEKEHIAIVLGKKIPVEQKDNLNSLILSALWAKYAKDNEVEPTAEEIDTFLLTQKEAAEKAQLEMVQDRDRLIAELKSTTLTKEKREDLEAELQVAEERLEIDRADKEGAKKMEALLRPMLRKMAEEWVMRWKLNKSLYDKYGGRVIFQQGGVEPLDAYRKFLEEEQNQGSFKIVHQADKDAFWRYFTTDSMHTFFDEEEGAKLISTPFWLMEGAEGE